ncbi:hypothetical protein HID58_084188 [Brassica napus]|uniref:Homeobox domain-containing protein n=1 Tax=Brassica napus TaxID=3708 RepID=A0ABQ7XL01_BRANA|nr:hypothetical protein HID58_084188 [Brassica napus]
MPADGDKHSAENSKKRKLKTPMQVMALENFYNEHKYPSEEMKAEIAEEIGLTEKQVSGWFCHRRLKDKRSVKEDGNNIGSQDRSSVVLQDRGSVLRQDSCGSTKQTDYWNPKAREVESQRLYDDDGEDSTSSERRSSLHKNLVSSKDVESSRYVGRSEHHPQAMRSHGASKPSGYLKVKGDSENVAITAVKRQLGRQYREDGPPLGVEFDPLPPGAFEPQTNNSQSMLGIKDGLSLHTSLELGRALFLVLYSNTVPDRKGPPQGVPLTNSKKSHISSKGRAEGSRNNLIDNFHNLSGTSQAHDYDKSILNGGRKTGYLTKSSNMLPLSGSRSSDSMERDTSSGMVGKYHGEKINHMKMHREKLHSTGEPLVTKRLKHGYPQQVYSETFERKDQINRSGVELPSSFNGDETEESSSSMD